MKPEPPKNAPRLSVVVVCGLSRRTARDTFGSLDRQTVPDHAMEVVVWDVAPGNSPPPRLPRRFATRYFRKASGDCWWRMRHEAAQHVAAGIIAFLEDHCIVDEGWAAGLLDAWDNGGLVAVGYAFTDGSGGTWWSESSLVSDYGRFLAPAATGPVPFLAGNNVSYSREFLETHSARFAEAGWCDFNLQEFACAQGLGMSVAPGAIVAHRCLERPADHLAANFFFVRLLAAERAKARKWKTASRWLRALAAPGIVPLLQLARTGRLCWDHPAKRRMFLRSLPLFYISALVAACGESMGLIAGPGTAGKRFNDLEQNAVRI